MTNNAKIKKWLHGKGQIQGTVRETWSKDEAQDVTIKSFVMTLERSQEVSQSTGLVTLKALKFLRVWLTDPLNQTTGLLRNLRALPLGRITRWKKALSQRDLWV